MKTYKLLLGFFVLIAIVLSCQKEKSFERGSAKLSSGSLQSGTTGDCLGNIVTGTYKKDTALNSTNYVDVKVDVIAAGIYSISTDTINGFYFSAFGTFGATGVNTVRLQGSGTPAAGGTNIFTVTYDSTQCTFSITTLTGGTGGTSVFTLAGSPSACTGATVQGIYTAGIATNSTNTATIQVDVTTAGTYSIATSAVNGITFAASGSLSSTGTQTITLISNGTPTASGSFDIPISIGSSSCSFQLTVVGASPAVYTLNGAPGNCTGATVQGIYVESTQLNTSNTATVQVNVTTIGSYSITTTAVNGITFTGSGSFSSTGLQSVVLIANGTPTASGSFTIPVTVGSSTCSFTLTVSTIDYFPRTTNSNWSYKYDNDPTDTLLQNVISQTQSALGNTYNIFMFNDGSGVDTLGYYRKASGDYYQYLDVGFFFQLDNESWGEYIFLKDNVPVNTTWTSNSFSNTFTDSTGTFPINVRFKETIQQKDVPVTVQGTTYQNTIVVKEEYEYSFDGGANWTAFPEYSTNYYSRNIGLIKIEFTDNSGNGGSYVQELTRYQVF